MVRYNHPVILSNVRLSNVRLSQSPELVEGYRSHVEGWGRAEANPIHCHSSTRMPSQEPTMYPALSDTNKLI